MPARRLLVLAFAVSMLASTAVAQPMPPAKPRLTMQLVDKVVVIGEPVSPETLDFKFSFGVSQVPFRLIGSVQLAAGTAQTKVRFTNGDVLSGEPQFSEIKLKTPYGLMTVPRSDIQTLSTGAPVAVAEAASGGLVLHLPLDGDAQDVSGKGNHGTMNGRVRFSTTPSGRAAYFTGSSSIVVNSNKSLQITGSQTIALWIKPTTLGIRTNPLHIAWGGEGSITLEDSGIVNYYYGQTGSDSGEYGTLPTSQPVVAGRWTHLCAVRDFKDNKLRMYLDGKLHNEVLATITKAGSASAPVLIGSGYTGNPYRGYIKDVRIYNRAVTAAEVKEIAETHKALLPATARAEPARE